MLFYSFKDLVNWLLDHVERWIVTFIETESIGSMRVYWVMNVSTVSVYVFKGKLLLNMTICKESLYILAFSITRDYQG